MTSLIKNIYGRPLSCVHAPSIRHGRRGHHTYTHHSGRYISHSGHDLPKRALIVTGATADLGSRLILEGIREGYKVYACVRDVHKFQKKHRLHHPNLEVISISTEGALDPSAWEQICKTVAKTHSFVGVINTIGGSIAPPGKTLHDINSRPAVASALGLKRVLSDTRVKGAYVNFSSMAAEVVPDSEYGSSRLKSDEDVLAASGDMPVVLLRAGLIFNDMSEEGVIDNGHPFSPEQFAHLPFKVLIGSGQQKMQPVYAGDVAIAAIKGLKAHQPTTVKGVGHEVMTQKEFFDFFHHLINPGRPTLHLHVPPTIMAAIAKHAPYGRLVGYSVLALQRLDSDPSAGVCPWQPFAKAIGKKPTRMGEIYNKDVHQRLIAVQAPLTSYTMLVAKTLMASQEFRRDLKDATLSELSKYIFGTKQTN